MAPRLVVLTGLTSSGKSTIADHLCGKHHFARLSADRMREALYGKNFLELTREPNGDHKEEIVWDTIQHMKQKYLWGGIDVVIDSTAAEHAMREAYLRTGFARARKYLIHVQVDPALRAQREIARGRNDIWRPRWDEPREGRGYTLLSYTNNTPEDRDRMLADLERHMI